MLELGAQSECTNLRLVTAVVEVGVCGEEVCSSGEVLVAAGAESECVVCELLEVVGGEEGQFEEQVVGDVQQQCEGLEEASGVGEEECDQLSWPEEGVCRGWWDDVLVGAEESDVLGDLPEWVQWRSLRVRGCEALVALLGGLEGRQWMDRSWRRLSDEERKDWECWRKWWRDGVAVVERLGLSRAMELLQPIAVQLRGGQFLVDLEAGCDKVSWSARLEVWSGVPGQWCSTWVARSDASGGAVAGVIGAALARSWGLVVSGTGDGVWVKVRRPLRPARQRR